MFKLKVVFVAAMLVLSSAVASADWGDNFNDNSLDLVKWSTLSGSAGGQPAYFNETNQRMEIGLPGGAWEGYGNPGGYAYLKSQDLYANPSWSNVNLTGMWKIDGNTSEMDIFIYNADDVSKYVRVINGTWQGEKLAFADSAGNYGVAAKSDWNNMVGFSLNVTNTGWTFSEGNTPLFNAPSSPLAGASKLYVQLGGGDYWRNPGDEWAYFDEINMSNVNAVPEPVSTVLFLVGGATLAARRLRRK